MGTCRIILSPSLEVRPYPKSAKVSIVRALGAYTLPKLAAQGGIEGAATLLKGGTGIGVAGEPGNILYVKGIADMTSDCDNPLFNFLTPK